MVLVLEVVVPMEVRKVALVVLEVPVTVVHHVAYNLPRGCLDLEVLRGFLGFLQTVDLRQKVVVLDDCVAVVPRNETHRPDLHRHRPNLCLALANFLN